nr:U1 small nuclear ribonucleoprotein C-like [Ipomoea batatas]
MPNQILSKVLYVLCLILGISFTRYCDARILKQENHQATEAILDFPHPPNSGYSVAGFPIPGFPVPPIPPISDNSVAGFPSPGFPVPPIPPISDNSVAGFPIPGFPVPN